jgi:hypothetical protein
MAICEHIQEKIVSKEALSNDEKIHVEACQDCASFTDAVETTSAALQATRARVPAAGEAEAIRISVLERIRPRSVGFRLAWSVSALVAGTILAVVVLSGAFGSRDDQAAEERLLSLLDEVSEITSVSGEDLIADAGEEAEIMARVLYEGDNTGDDSDSEFPGAYGLLEEALENSWL